MLTKYVILMKNKSGLTVIMSYFYLNPVLMKSFSPCDLNSMSGSSGDSGLNMPSMI